MAIAVTAMAPNVLPTSGGVEITLTGTFPVGEDLQVHLGPLGTTADPTCYGTEGFGRLPRALNATTLVVVSPPLAKTANVKATAVRIAPPEQNTLNGAGKVVERAWAGKQFGLRSLFPAWYGVGARRLDQEAPL